jgi:hypothetical protein
LTEKPTHPPANKEQSVSENEQKGRGAKKCFCLGEGKEINVGARGGREGGRRVFESSKMEPMATLFILN